MLYYHIVVEEKRKEFANVTAALQWIELNYPFVQLIGFSETADLMGYDTPPRLQKPKVVMRYREFSKEYPF